MWISNSRYQYRMYQICMHNIKYQTRLWTQRRRRESVSDKVFPWALYNMKGTQQLYTQQMGNELEAVKGDLQDEMMSIQQSIFCEMRQSMSDYSMGMAQKAVGDIIAKYGCFGKRI